MDRDRLQQVQQSDLSESRVNQEFVDWLKTKGPNWLLVVLVAICGFLFIQQWKQRNISYTDTAWQAFTEADSPLSLIDVAEEYPDVGTLASLARLSAARIYLEAVRQAQPVQAILNRENTAALIDDAGTAPFTEELRDDYLRQADQLFETILSDPAIASAGADSAALLYAINALNGRGSVAESRGDAQSAADFFNQAADKADGFDTTLATVCRTRADTAALDSERIVLASNPEDAEVPDFQSNPGLALSGPPITPEADLEPIVAEPSLSSIISDS